MNLKANTLFEDPEVWMARMHGMWYSPTKTGRCAPAAHARGIFAGSLPLQMLVETTCTFACLHELGTNEQILGLFDVIMPNTVWSMWTRWPLRGLCLVALQRYINTFSLRPPLYTSPSQAFYITSTFQELL